MRKIIKEIKLCWPMRGKSFEQITKEFGFLKADVERLGYNVDISKCICFDKGTNDDKDAAWYLGWSLQQMCDVDEVWFLDGWRAATGCAVEHKVCQEYGIPYKYWDGVGDPV